MASSTVAQSKEKATGEFQPGSESPLVTLLKYIGLGIGNVLAVIMVYTFFYDGNGFTGLVLGIITVFINVVVFFPQLAPLRWMTPGLSLSMMLVIYPLLFTVTTAFTNYSTGNLLTKDQTVQQIIKVGGGYAPEGAREYDWDATYRNDAGEYALWLTREGDAGSAEAVFAPAGAPIEEVGDAPEEAPESYNGYTLLTRAERTQALTELQSIVFGVDDDTAGITGRSSASRPLVPTFAYDAETDTIVNQETGERYVANEEFGFFVREGFTPTSDRQALDNSLQPGYRVNVGLYNFTRVFADPALRGPLVNIFVWTVLFALLSVFTTFALGLMVALVLNDPMIPYRKIIRSILLVPYAIPGVIAIVIWRGMMNQNIGIFNDILNANIPWLTDTFLAKASLVLVNLWLGYPYMMLVTSGALQAIPSEVYEAAAVDGAKPWQRFWNITLPLLLLAVGPLLMASFIYNFNNYLLIEALTGGGPPILGSLVPNAGESDILISYVYKSAFSSEADYGYASAITIVIFLIVALVTLIQFRITNQLEELSENV